MTSRLDAVLWAGQNHLQEVDTGVTKLRGPEAADALKNAKAADPTGAIGKLSKAKSAPTVTPGSQMGQRGPNAPLTKAKTAKDLKAEKSIDEMLNNDTLD